MNYVKFFVLSAITLAFAYYCSLLLIVPSPVSSAYWVGQMITVKRNMVKAHHGKKKVIVGGGSSSLFGIDAEAAGKALGMPVINFGLHAGLRLERILFEAGQGAESGDIIVLQIEPSYYNCGPKFNGWRVKNVIAWDVWERSQMGVRDRIKFFTSISPSQYAEILVAKFEETMIPGNIARRLTAMDSLATMEHFRSRKDSGAFKYSVFNLDDYGSIRRANGSLYYGGYTPLMAPGSVCSDVLVTLRMFVEEMRARGVHVYFMNPPYVKGDSSCIKKRQIDSVDAVFLSNLKPWGVMIDSRASQVFDRELFYNTFLHLNSKGRAVRTGMFVDAVRREIFQAENVSRSQP